MMYLKKMNTFTSASPTHEEKMVLKPHKWKLKVKLLNLLEYSNSKLPVCPEPEERLLFHTLAKKELPRLERTTNTKKENLSSPTKLMQTRLKFQSLKRIATKRMLFSTSPSVHQFKWKLKAKERV